MQLMQVSQIVTFDSDSPNSNRTTFLGTSNYQAGVTAADYIGDKLGGKGRVACLTRTGQSNINERIDGFTTELADKYPDIEMVQVVDAGNDENEAATNLSSLLSTDSWTLIHFCSTSAGSSRNRDSTFRSWNYRWNQSCRFWYRQNNSWLYQIRFCWSNTVTVSIRRRFLEHDLCLHACKPGLHQICWWLVCKRIPVLTGIWWLRLCSCNSWQRRYVLSVRIIKYLQIIWTICNFITAGCVFFIRASCY